jgi:hypothetical protein
MNWWQVTLMLEMAAAILASVFLNCFWFALIIKQVVRMFQREGSGNEELEGKND